MLQLLGLKLLMFLMLKKLKFSGIIITLSFVQLNSIKGIGEGKSFCSQFDLI